jgi:phosphoenolpyruvate synthase/pyruvate phosphate dikinase
MSVDKKSGQIEIKYTQDKKGLELIAKGTPAYAGKMMEDRFAYTKAYIVEKGDKTNLDTKINVGDALVTQMTDPGYMPLILRSSVIITERANSKTLCHAAIVSYKFKINCILSAEGVISKIDTGDDIFYKLAQGDKTVAEVYKKNE